MKTNRGLVKFILLSLITCGIYALFFWSAYARDMNIVCAGDGKHTGGIIKRILLSMITFGIYELVWMYGVGERISVNCHKRGIHCNVTGGSVLLWYLLGSLIVVGPFIACYKMFDGLNELCHAYNVAPQGSSPINVTVNVNRD